jgi:hypothetical protein
VIKDRTVIKEKRRILVAVQMNRGTWHSFVHLCHSNEMKAYRAVEVLIEDVLARHGFSIDNGPYAPENGEVRELLEGRTFQTGGVRAVSRANE